MKSFFTKIGLQNWIIILLVVLNAATLSFMWINRPPKPMEPKEVNYQERANHYFMHKLQFSEQQMEQFRSYQEAHFEEMKLYREEIMALKKQLYQLENNEASQEKINELIKNMSTIYAGQEKAHFAHIQQLRSICTPEQLPQMEKMLKRIIYQGNHDPHRGRRN